METFPVSLEEKAAGIETGSHIVPLKEGGEDSYVQSALSLFLGKLNRFPKMIRTSR